MLTAKEYAKKERRSNCKTPCREWTVGSKIQSRSPQKYNVRETVEKKYHILNDIFK